MPTLEHPAVDADEAPRALRARAYATRFVDPLAVHQGPSL
jgi:hypothetical protein